MGSCISCIEDYIDTCFLPSCQYRGFCSFPHGCCYSIMGIMMGFGGVFMNMYVVVSCFFNRIHRIDPVSGEEIKGEERGYGFLARETDYGMEPDYAQCSRYKDYEYDEYYDIWMSSARFFGFMSWTLGVIAFFILIATCCVSFSSSMYERWLLWAYIFAAIAMALTMLFFGSEMCKFNKCTVAQGSGWAISTFLLWLTAANTVKSMGQAPPQKPGLPQLRNPFKDRENKKGRRHDHHLVDDADLYYENEADKYPPIQYDLPEENQEGQEMNNRDGDYDDDDEEEDYEPENEFYAGEDHDNMVSQDFMVDDHDYPADDPYYGQQDPQYYPDQSYYQDGRNGAQGGYPPQQGGYPQQQYQPGQPSYGQGYDGYEGQQRDYGGYRPRPPQQQPPYDDGYGRSGYADPNARGVDGYNDQRYDDPADGYNGYAADGYADGRNDGVVETHEEVEGNVGVGYDDEYADNEGGRASRMGDKDGPVLT